MFFLQIENAFGIEFTSYAHYETDEKQVSFFLLLIIDLLLNTRLENK